MIEIDDMQEVENEIGNTKQNQKLMKKLMMKPDKRWVYVFKESLENKPGCEHLFNLING